MPYARANYCFCVALQNLKFGANSTKLFFKQEKKNYIIMIKEYETKKNFTLKG